MKILPQQSRDLILLAQFVKDTPVAMLAGVDARGQLLSQPMTPLEMDAQGSLWFFADLQSDKLSRLQAMNLSSCDTAHATYVSLSGRGEVVMDRERIKRLWSPLARPWFPDWPGGCNLALLKFMPDNAEYWDAPASRVRRMLTLAVSAVVGKPLGQGSHESLSRLTGRPSAASIQESA